MEKDFSSFSIKLRKESGPKLVTADPSQMMLAISPRLIQVWMLGAASGPFYTREEDGAQWVCIPVRSKQIREVPSVLAFSRSIRGVFSDTLEEVEITSSTPGKLLPTPGQAVKEEMRAALFPGGGITGVELFPDEQKRFVVLWKKS